MIRRLVLLGAIAAGIVGGILYYRAVTRPREVILTGIVTTHDVIVSSQVQGRLAELHVQEGDQVKAGEVVAIIAPQELKADRAFYEHSEQSSQAQVDEAEAALKFQILQTRDQISQAEAQLAATESQQAEAAADLESARLDLERAEGLYKQQIQSAQVYDHARTAYEAAQARMKALAKQGDAQRAAVALARAAEEQIEVRRSQLLAGRRLLAAARAQADKAQVRLDYTEIRAPIDGLVAASAARRGEVVNPGQPIVSLVNPDDFWVRADVEETYIDRVRLGEQMQVRLPSGVERAGTVFYRSVDADYATQRDVSRTKRDIKTFEIRLRCDNRDRSLALGMTAYVTLPLASR
jgi:HlyD family secretion protein